MVKISRNTIFTRYTPSCSLHRIVHSHPHDFQEFTNSHQTFFLFKAEIWLALAIIWSSTLVFCQCFWDEKVGKKITCHKIWKRAMHSSSRYLNIKSVKHFQTLSENIAVNNCYWKSNKPNGMDMNIHLCKNGAGAMFLRSSHEIFHWIWLLLTNFNSSFIFQI